MSFIVAVPRAVERYAIAGGKRAAVSHPQIVIDM